MIIQDCIENEVYLKKIDELAKTYKVSTGVDCIAFDVTKKEVKCNNRSSFCRLVQKYDKETCQKSYLYSSFIAKKHREPYVFFCPYGLVNWTVPIYIKNEVKNFLTAGAVLLHQVDDILLENIFWLNPKLREERKLTERELAKLTVLDTVRVRHLSEMLFHLAKIFVVENSLNTKRIIDVEVDKTKKIGKISFKNKDFAFKLQEKEKELITSVKLGDKNKATQIASEIIEFTNLSHSLNFSKTMAINLVVLASQNIKNFNGAAKTISDLKFKVTNNIIKATKFKKVLELTVEAIEKIIEVNFVTPNSENKDLIFKAIKYIRENYRDVSLNDVSFEVGLTATYFSKLFKKETGQSFTDYLNLVKVEVSKDWLKKDFSIVEICEKVGFKNQSYFSKVFKKYEKTSPSFWKKQVL